MKRFSEKCVARAATIYWHHQAYTENNRLTLAVLLLSTQHYRQLINCDHDHDYAHYHVHDGEHQQYHDT